MYFTINGINVNKVSQNTCFTADITRIGTPPTNNWRISMCGDTDAICPDLTYNQTYLPPLDVTLTYDLSAAGYCKAIGSKMTAKVEYFDGLRWITDVETTATYTIEASRLGLYLGIAAGLVILNSMMSKATSKITRR